MGDPQEAREVARFTIKLFGAALKYFRSLGKSSETCSGRQRSHFSEDLLLNVESWRRLSGCAHSICLQNVVAKTAWQFNSLHRQSANPFCSIRAEFNRLHRQRAPPSATF